MKTKQIIKDIVLNPQKPSLISKSSVFVYKDSDFKNWNLDNDTPAKKMTLEVREMTSDSNYKDMFSELGDLDVVALTQGQIIAFCKEHKESLRQDGWATLFLFKNGSEFFVADVDVQSDGLNVHVYRFGNDSVWAAELSHRMVVPQLITSNLKSETLISSDTLSLEKAIAICKENGLVVYEPK